MNRTAKMEVANFILKVMIWEIGESDEKKATERYLCWVGEIGG